MNDSATHQPSPGPTTIPTNTIRVRSREDLLASLPYLLGFHPADSLCVIGMDTQTSQMTYMIRVDLPGRTDPESFGNWLSDLLDGKHVDSVILVGYGDDEHTTPAITAAHGAISDRAGINIADALRVENSRYWTVPSCPDPACCPADGTAYDPTESQAAATAVACGLAALSSHADLKATLAPQRGAAHTTMATATTRAAAHLGEQIQHPGSTQRLIKETSDLIGQALRAHASGIRLSDDDAARLSVLMEVPRLRDEAYATMTPGTVADHVAVWTDMIRRARTGVPAIGCLLSFACYHTGDGARANIALDRALATDPQYRLALLLREVLALGIPPSDRFFVTADELAAAADDEEGEGEAESPMLTHDSLTDQ